MLIVSQNKEEIVNSECVDSIFITCKDIAASSVAADGDVWVLGTYETHQRVSQVMQEIWSAYANGQKVYQMP